MIMKSDFFFSPYFHHCYLYAVFSSICLLFFIFVLYFFMCYSSSFFFFSFSVSLFCFCTVSSFSSCIFYFPPSISPYLCISSQASHFHNLTDFVTQVTPMVPISLETWSLSFAKYLELRFYGGSFNRRGTQGCTHSLHHDHFQYFGYKNQVAVFK